jgi:integrase
MAGLEPARAFYGPTDFKSVASAISPHRQISEIQIFISNTPGALDSQLTCSCRKAIISGMKKPKIEVREYRNSKTGELYRPPYKFLLDLRAYGKGRKFFKTRAEADAEARRQKNLLEIHSREAIGLSQREMSDFIHARNTLAGYGKKIGDAVTFLVTHLERVRRHGITVAKLVKELLEAKRKDGRSEIYLRDLRNILAGPDGQPSAFSRDFGNRPIAGITVEELDEWLRALPGSLKTRENFRANISVLFGYATKRRILDFNPVLHTEKPKMPENPPEIFTVDELRSLLEAASKVAPGVLPMLAIGAFAGVRDAEIKRLDWHEIDLVRGHIEIKGAKAKSARRRIIPIQPNLAAWLRPYSEKKGRLIPEGYRSSLERVRKEAELARWPQNGLRHSFASYRLAATNNAPLVASELGHTSPLMLYSIYRELVLPEEAERYWKVVPGVKAANVVAFSG